MLKKIFRFIFMAIAVILGIGLFLPGTTRVEREIDIQTPTPMVFAQLNDLKNWENWSPWLKIDPQIEMAYAPQTEGVGAWYTWKSLNKGVGTGKVTILDVKTNELVHYKLLIDGWSEATSDLKCSVKDSLSTHVTWRFDGEHGMNPLSRWLGFVAFERFVAPDYEKGLMNLKVVCESKK